MCTVTSKNALRRHFIELKMTRKIDIPRITENINLLDAKKMFFFKCFKKIIFEHVQATNIFHAR